MTEQKTASNHPLLYSTILFFILIIGFIIMVRAYDQLLRPGPIGCAFNLMGSNGQVITEKTVRAKPAVVFFGYTHCPDICPTTLTDISRWLKELGPDADKLGVYFFSVDPARDTPTELHDFLSNISDKIIGVSGDPAEVQKVIKSFNITAVKVPGENSDYTFDHTAAVILFHKGGVVSGIIPYQPDVASTERDGIALDKLRNLIEETEHVHQDNFLGHLMKRLHHLLPHLF